MVEQVRVNPEEVRGYGNICEEHSLEDFIVSSSALAKEKENVHGALTDVYKLVYSLYGFVFDFDTGNKQLYLQMGEANILSFGFDDDSKQLYLLDEAGVGFSLGFDEDTNELYITDDAPPIVHNYTLALDSDSYTTSGSLSVSATLLDDGVAVEGATVSFTGGVSTVTATTNSSGVATATVNFTSSGTLTASYSNVSDTATVTVSSSIYSSALTSDDGNWAKSGYDCSVTYNSDGLTVLGNNTGGDAFYKLDETKVSVPHTNIVAEYTVVAIGTGLYGESTEFVVGNMDVDMSNASLQILNRATGSILYTGTMPSRPFNVRVEIDTSQAKCYINDTLRATTTLNYQYIGFKTYKDRTITIKDLEITPLDQEMFEGDSTYEGCTYPQEQIRFQLKNIKVEAL